MSFYLGVDGGGTKTQFLLTAANRAAAAAYRTGGCDIRQVGADGFSALLKEGIARLLRQVGGDREELRAAALGIPCFGEDPQADQLIRERVQRVLAGTPCRICNDVEVGWAGALGLRPGIHLVAGTGAIAFGKNAAGETARSNGWHEAFSDEGSGYWLGLRTLSLFAKQADGRLPKGPLYGLLCAAWGLENPMEAISYFSRQLAGRRDRVANLQLLLEQAAKAGDPSAQALYRRAAEELALSVAGVWRQLHFSPEDRIPVTYSGGVCRVGELLLDPLREAVGKLGVRLEAPAFSPAQGAVLLAVQMVGGDLEGIIKTFEQRC